MSVSGRGGPAHPSPCARRLPGREEPGMGRPQFPRRAQGGARDRLAGPARLSVASCTGSFAPHKPGPKPDPEAGQVSRVPPSWQLKKCLGLSPFTTFISSIPSNLCSGEPQDPCCPPATRVWAEGGSQVDFFGCQHILAVEAGKGMVAGCVRWGTECLCLLRRDPARPGEIASHQCYL